MTLKLYSELFIEDGEYDILGRMTFYETNFASIIDAQLFCHSSRDKNTLLSHSFGYFFLFKKKN
jgi:hypothetical protein